VILALAGRAAHLEAVRPPGTLVTVLSKLTRVTSQPYCWFGGYPAPRSRTPAWPIDPQPGKPVRPAQEVVSLLDIPQPVLRA